jgi:hypothetical protein
MQGAKQRTQTACFKALALGSTGLDEKNIAVFDNIFFALSHDLSGRFDRGFIASLLESVIVEDNCLDECLLEIYSFSLVLGFYDLQWF